MAKRNCGSNQKQGCGSNQKQAGQSAPASRSRAGASKQDATDNSNAQNGSNGQKNGQR